MAVDDSPVDMGSVQLCVRCSVHIPSRVSIWWGSWSFSLPIWVETSSMVELAMLVAVAGADLRLDKEGRDSCPTNRRMPTILGVKDYMQRFGRETEYRGFRVGTQGRFGNRLGFKGDFRPISLSHAKAHKDRFNPMGTHRWSKTKQNVPLVLGHTELDVGHQKWGSAQSNQGELVLGQPNSTISRVFALLYTGVGPSQPSSEVGLLVEAARPLVGGAGDGRETTELMAKAHWVDLVDELALLVCLEKACNREEVTDVANEADDQPEFARDEYPST
ncbi:hypothetical protein LOK49_LG07G00227 [Camellia lanceoleosa]|uniref:Uncharacterized protein n=1 Tax=Camellia lanceoleosa TaxID=1840588 RepID=A0ACC0H9W5_9ERIC|nr:hypothetical protein LOK49_LG07G00227 [Camellia lanceoleosa]